MHKRTLLGAGLFFLIMILLAADFVLERRAAEAPLPVLGAIQPFQLNDTLNRAFDSQQLNNKIWVADFFFTSCGGICPLMTKNMAALHRSYLLNDAVEFVSISVNPENDTPKILEDYAKRYKADLKKWHFLTGPRERITDVALRSFKIGSVDEPVFHSAFFALVDQKGQIRGYYDGTKDDEIQLLFKDLASLLSQKK